MADEIKKVADEVKEEIESVQEGAIPDDEVEAVAGGEEGLRRAGGDSVAPIIDSRTGVVPGSTNRKRH